MMFVLNDQIMQMCAIRRGGGWVGGWGCAVGWGHIFMTGMTIMGLTCQEFSIKFTLLEWGCTFKDSGSKKIICPKSD